LKAGDYFGENALLRNEPRTATIKATSDVKALKITRKIFTDLGLDQKLLFAKRGAVGGAAAGDAKIQAPAKKSPDEIALISSALKSNSNLNTMIELDDAKIKGITDLMWKETVPAGTAVITQGDLQADFFYVLQSGSMAVSKKADDDGKEGQSVEAAVGTEIGTIPAGSSFGELALLLLCTTCSNYHREGRVSSFRHCPAAVQRCDDESNRS
jgi:CRP-like cAMP-binding protein